MNATETKTTTEQQINSALLELSGDWDEDGTVPAYLPAAAARGFLEANGWTRTNDGGGSDRHSQWEHGATGHTCWGTDEAVQIEIIAQSK